MGLVDITVHPVEGGWSIGDPFSGCGLMFLSGGKAEAKARELGRLAAVLGFDAQVSVRDGRWGLVDRLSFEAIPRHGPLRQARARRNGV